MADNQALTRAGALHFIRKAAPGCLVLEADRKATLVQRLVQHPNALVVLDYTLFDFMRAQELINLSARFPSAHILLLSAELSGMFVKQVAVDADNISLVFKGDAEDEVVEAIRAALHGERYLCARAKELLNTAEESHEKVPLSKTEVGILQLIVLGKSSKEVADIRCISQHTVVAHRKNIFRKLGVNTAYEAIRYAMRMGLADAADYQI
ncbi:MAG: response regulator transcription factor [Prevotellaceae bacterium]|jgi:DNA-binding NarL/FixJ family response regulator|nr:response regulator transcription factor [Prevotellaceae bacterium]